MLSHEQVDVPMAFETLKQAGSELGTGAIIAMDETTCMVEVTRRLSKFFAHESCGRCTPCRLGSYRIFELLDRLEHGRGQPGDDKIDGLTFCPMGAALANPPRSAIRLFREEFEYHLTHKMCLV